MTDPELRLGEDPAAELGAALGSRALEGGTIVLTGGSSIGRAYEHAAATGDWSRSSVWWGDERCVPPDDERSNYGLARRTLLDRLAVLPEVHRIHGELEPALAAAEYERELDGVHINLLLLGLGPDGHIASLFPGSPQLAEHEGLVTSGPAGLAPWVDRVTLTLPALLLAELIWFLVTGPDKAEAVRRSFREPVTDAVPASLLREGSAPIVVFLDQAAASGL